MKKGRNCYQNESVYEYCFRINVRFIFCCWKLFLILVLFLFDFLRMIVLSLYHLNCDFFVRSHPIWIDMYLFLDLKYLYFRVKVQIIVLHKHLFLGFNHVVFHSCKQLEFDFETQTYWNLWNSDLVKLFII